MPQTRTLLHQTSRLRVEHVRSHARPVQWSPLYLAPAARLILADCDGVIDFKLQHHTALLDGVTALFLPAGQPYQMRPGDSQEKTSLVVSWPGRSTDVDVNVDAEHGADAVDAVLTSAVTAAPSAQVDAAFLLPPQALWALRLHWHHLRVGCGARLSTRQVVTQALAHAHRPVALGASGMAAVDRAQRFMATQMAQDAAAALNQRDVADAAHCSLFHLARLFRARFGLGMHGYRQRLRLALALQALAGGERNLASLATRLGFSQQSQMGAQFRAALGLTPGQARDALTRTTPPLRSAGI